MVKDRANEKEKAKIKVRGRGKVPEFLRFKSPSGLEVVAGRSSRQNDRVTWGVAKDKDLWFHARGVGGSHVVLIIPRHKEASIEDIEFAASVAAQHSKAKLDTKVDVSFTERKYLRQPPVRYRKPGSVLITREQVVTVRPKDLPRN